MVTFDSACVISEIGKMLADAYHEYVFEKAQCADSIATADAKEKIESCERILRKRLK